MIYLIMSDWIETAKKMYFRMVKANELLCFLQLHLMNDDIVRYFIVEYYFLVCEGYC